MNEIKNKILYIVIPCFNEQDVLPVTLNLFIDKIHALIDKFKLSDDSKLLFVNDGSFDCTWKIIKEASYKDYHCIGISLSKNMGHQNALIAGLYEARTKCDICVSIDCDGQDDIDAIDEMIYEYSKGNDIVYGVRNDRKSDSILKKITAETYYKFLNMMAGGGRVIYNHADYRLVSKRALEALALFNESNIYLRGVFPLIGYSQTIVEYKRAKRIKGESHYPLPKMLGLALNGITNLSIKPLRVILFVGTVVSALSFAGVIWSLVLKINGDTISGWASTICIICLVSGFQLISIGIIGEYIGKIYMETKNRPKFIIEDRT